MLLNFNLIRPNLSLIFWSSSSTLRREDKGTWITCESSRSTQQTWCFKCQGFGHVSAQYSSKVRTIIETHSDDDQDDLEEIVHDPKGDTWEDGFDVDLAVTLGCVLSMHSHLIDDVGGVTRHLSVVSAPWLNLKKMTTDIDLQIFKLSLKLMVIIVRL